MSIGYGLVIVQFIYLTYQSMVCVSHGAMKLLDNIVWRSRYLSSRTKVCVFGSLVMPVLLYSFEAWTLTAYLRRWLDSLATSSLRRILCYSWQDRMSNQEVLRGAGMSRVTCLIWERQLRFYGHVVRFPMDDPAHRILNAKYPVEGNRGGGVPNRRG